MEGGREGGRGRDGGSEHTHVSVKTSCQLPNRIPYMYSTMYACVCIVLRSVLHMPEKGTGNSLVPSDSRRQVCVQRV